jgi:hypothetical protein
MTAIGRQLPHDEGVAIRQAARVPEEASATGSGIGGLMIVKLSPTGISDPAALGRWRQPDAPLICRRSAFNSQAKVSAAE